MNYAYEFFYFTNRRSAAVAGAAPQFIFQMPTERSTSTRTGPFRFDKLSDNDINLLGIWSLCRKEQKSNFSIRSPDT